MFQQQIMYPASAALLACLDRGLSLRACSVAPGFWVLVASAFVVAGLLIDEPEGRSTLSLTLVWRNHRKYRIPHHLSWTASTVPGTARLPEGPLSPTTGSRRLRQEFSVGRQGRPSTFAVHAMSPHYFCSGSLQTCTRGQRTLFILQMH